MSIKKNIMAFVLIVAAIFSSASLGANNNINDFNAAFDKNIILNTQEQDITMRDISNFLKTKEEHYPLSDEFIEKYQQKSGGYIDNAKKAGLVVDKRLHEPNQKWHYFESWLYPTIEEGMEWTASAKTRVYNNLQCPELLLWIYEACEVSPTKVKLAKEIAEQGRASNANTKTISTNMKTAVFWTDITPAIIKFMQESQDPYKVSYENSSDYEIIGLNKEYKPNDLVTFSVNVLNKAKTIENIKSNNEILTSNNGSYSFNMPYEDVMITVELKDVKPATSVTLNPVSLTLTVGDKNKIVTATILPSDTTDIPVWSIEEGNDIISINPSNNEVKITALKEGTAKLKITLNDKISEFCNVIVNPKDPASIGEIYSKYNVEYDLGTRTTAKKIETAEDVYKSFVEETDEKILTSISDFNNYIYGGGNGGSGETRWYSGDMIKMGTTSYNGSLTFELSHEINQVIITGYVHTSACAIKIGNSTSGDWSDSNDGLTKSVELSTMNVASLEAISSNNTSSITIDIESTSSLKIETTTKKPLYITSIEFIYK